MAMVPSGLITQIKVALVTLHIYQGRTADCRLLHVPTAATGSGGQVSCFREQLRDVAGSSDLPLEECSSLHLPRGIDVLTRKY